MRFIQRAQSPVAGRRDTVARVAPAVTATPAPDAARGSGRVWRPVRCWPVRLRPWRRGGWGSVRRSARTRTQGATRGHPHRRAAAAGGGAAQRLPDHAGGPGAKRRHLEPEPRLGLPGAGAARGRGPDPHAGEPTDASCSRSPTRAARSSTSAAPTVRLRGSRRGEGAVGSTSWAGSCARSRTRSCR